MDGIFGEVSRADTPLTDLEATCSPVGYVVGKTRWTPRQQPKFGSAANRPLWLRASGAVIAPALSPSRRIPSPSTRA